MRFRHDSAATLSPARSRHSAAWLLAGTEGSAARDCCGAETGRARMAADAWRGGGTFDPQAPRAAIEKQTIAALVQFATRKAPVGITRMTISLPCPRCPAYRPPRHSRPPVSLTRWKADFPAGLGRILQCRPPCQCILGKKVPSFAKGILNPRVIGVSTGQRLPEAWRN